jgi:hypothetical protein
MGTWGKVIFNGADFAQAIKWYVAALDSIDFSKLPQSNELTWFELSFDFTIATRIASNFKEGSSAWTCLKEELARTAASHHDRCGPWPSEVKVTTRGEWARSAHLGSAPNCRILMLVLGCLAGIITTWPSWRGFWRARLLLAAPGLLDI